jgi:hypothetical protein
MRTIETSLEDALERPDLRLRAPSAERFGYGGAKAQRSSGLAWETPSGWTGLASTTMRVANFRIGGDEHTECYVTLFPGDGGGTLANVNRWRQQLGRDELSTAQLDELPRIPMLGGEAVMVEIEGTLRSKDATPDAKVLMLGAVASLGDRTVFVKLTGPRERVEPERESFRAFCGLLSQTK